MAQAPKAISQRRGFAISERVRRIAETGAVATTSAFAGGALLSQTVIVPTWRAMEPGAFLQYFRTYGPATGATVFPFELASVLLLGLTTYSATKAGRPGRLAWAVATACMVGTLLLLIYFVPTNLALIGHSFPPQAVDSELTAWYRWNWVRAGLGLASAAAACLALITSRRETTMTQSP